MAPVIRRVCLHPGRETCAFVNRIGPWTGVFTRAIRTGADDLRRDSDRFRQHLRVRRCRRGSAREDRGRSAIFDIFIGHAAILRRCSEDRSVSHWFTAPCSIAGEPTSGDVERRPEHTHGSVESGTLARPGPFMRAGSSVPCLTPASSSFSVSSTSSSRAIVPAHARWCSRPSVRA
jgi:hypothetical protein